MNDCCRVMPVTRLNAQAREATPATDMHSIENQISALRELVLQQDIMLKKQQELILRQEAKIEQLREPAGNGKRPVTPFEAQSAAGYGGKCRSAYQYLSCMLIEEESCIVWKFKRTWPAFILRDSMNHQNYTFDII